MRIACQQAACGTTGLAHSLDQLRQAARRAAEAGAELLVTPEISIGGYPLLMSNLKEACGPVDGPQCAEVDAIAREFSLALVHGWPETDGGELYNSARLVSPQGDTLAVYRKAHLYGRGERAMFTPGEQGVVQTSYNGLTLGLLICYDVEFPEAVRAHGMAGTDLLLVPTGLMRPWDFVARTLVPARAFESQLYIAYANWTGTHGGIGFAGHTTVAAPDGGSQALPEQGEGLLVADVDPEVLRRARAATTYLQDRRPELYPS
ncbi:carbon-nitrogen hydrolase family protein [Streptomyces sp. SAJ15]|uniref:carbon-nitrogen hydrolase family protein n=1 Tax=Streptomyces sp. SAJ15 TaxID=2011095 RepID=UPI0011851C8E|nr:carbon-nitrogen hydrolase family protein [Streptomyces sp. SAJ15]TVL91765.1 carbon-nitrogen hydrolase [Streptomyces sp. SAJ15]